MSATKVHVGNLSSDTTDNSLRSCFTDYGNVLDAIVMIDRDTGSSRGFGFVTFENHEGAEAAISNMDQQEIDGNQVTVKLANARPTGNDRGNMGGPRGGYSGGGGHSGGYGGGY